MTNTKLRKRALLSSVAMLLVALVALGSATFAWFAESPDAYAQGLTIKTTAAAGLDIKSETQGTWGKSAILNYDSSTQASKTDAFNLVPVSQGQNTTSGETVTGHSSIFNQIVANASGAKAAKSDSTTKFVAVTPGHSGNEGVYSETVYFQLSSTASAAASRDVLLNGVTLTSADNATMAGVIRVAVADSTGKLLGTYALNSAAPDGAIPHTATNGTWGDMTLGEYSPALTATGTSGNQIAVTGVTAATGVTKSTNNGKYVVVYVYLDGQDGNCYTDKVTDYDAAAILSSIKLDFTLAPEA